MTHRPGDKPMRTPKRSELGDFNNIAIKKPKSNNQTSGVASSPTGRRAKNLGKNPYPV